jgi:hypothetical protein
MSEGEQLHLERKIERYRRMLRDTAADSETAKLIQELITDLERKHRDLEGKAGLHWLRAVSHTEHSKLAICRSGAMASLRL